MSKEIGEAVQYCFKFSMTHDFFTVKHIVSTPPNENIKQNNIIHGRLNRDLLETLLPFRPDHPEKETNMIYVSGGPDFNQDIEETLINIGFSEQSFYVFGS